MRAANGILLRYESSTLQELYAAPQIDGRSLKELWSEADDFYCPNFEP